MLAESVWAEVKICGEHLRLFSEHSPLGVHAPVYHAAAKSWIAPCEPMVTSTREKRERRRTRGRIIHLSGLRVHQAGQSLDDGTPKSREHSLHNLGKIVSSEGPRFPRQRYAAYAIWRDVTTHVGVSPAREFRALVPNLALAAYPSSAGCPVEPLTSHGP